MAINKITMAILNAAKDHLGGCLFFIPSGENDHADTFRHAENLEDIWTGKWDSISLVDLGIQPGTYDLTTPVPTRIT